MEMICKFFQQITQTDVYRCSDTILNLPQKIR